jgi:hypothetical protein
MMKDIRLGQLDFLNAQVTANYVDLSSTATQQLIVAGARMIEVVPAGVLLSFSFRIRRLTDLFVMNDFLMAEITKFVDLADTFPATDSALRSVGKALSDPFAFADSITLVWTVVRAFFETATLVDSAALATARATSDALTVTDASALQTGGSYGDFVTTTDARTLAVSSAYADSVTFSETFFTAIGLSFSLADSLSMGDTAPSIITTNIESSVPNVSALGTFMLNQ